jgi:integrase
MSAVLWWARRVLDLADEHDKPQIAKQAARVLSIKVSKIVKGTTPPAGRHLDESELSALLTACHDGTPAGARDAALFALSWTTGLRRAELTALTMADIDHGNACATLTVIHGKGGKARPAYVYNGAYKALLSWLALRGDCPGYIFCPVRKNGIPAPELGISGEALRKIERKRELQSSVEHFSSHDFRRTWVGNLLEDGNDLATVQVLAGHASPVTTARYDRRPEETRRAAIQNIHIPEIGE